MNAAPLTTHAETSIENPAEDSILSILIYSPIPVAKEKSFLTLDLWAKDLNAQADEGISITLLCEILENIPSEWQGSAQLDARIKVIGLNGNAKIADLLADVHPDIFQVPGNAPWQHSRVSREIVSVAKSRRIPVVVGISSNRAKTQVLNAANSSWIRKGKAYLQALSIRASQFYLTSMCDGAFIVGDGLRHLVSPLCKNLHVGVASWISRSQIHPRTNQATLPPLKLAVAARLEPMKGIHLAVEAFEDIGRQRLSRSHSGYSGGRSGEGESCPSS